MTTKRKKFPPLIPKLCWLIALLLAASLLIIPAIQTGHAPAERSKAGVEASDVAHAVALYYLDYGRPPIPPEQTGREDGPMPEAQGAEWNARVVEVLAARPAGWNEDHALNPREKVYLDPDSVPPEGPMRDPWGRPYRIVLDRDGDGDIENPAGDPIVERAVWVVSFGPDGEFNGLKRGRTAGDDISSAP